MTSEKGRRHPSSERFHAILQECGELHDKKQEDYGTDDDPFNNVRASAKEWGVPPWFGAMLRATDKVKRLQTFYKKGKLANEPVKDAFNDLTVYAAMARVLFEEESQSDLDYDPGICPDTSVDSTGHLIS